MNLQIGDIIQTKKSHPCGNDRWQIMRVGMDFRLKCLGCGRMILIPRLKVEKSIKTVVKQGTG